MKFTLITDLLKEDASTINISKAMEASMLNDRKMIDQLAEKIQKDGFPEKFNLPVKLSTGGELVLEWELYEKAINENKSHHMVTFTYEHTRETTVKIRQLLKQAEKDDEDTDGEKYDALSEELSVDMIHVRAEFDKEFTKVYGDTK